MANQKYRATRLLICLAVCCASAVGCMSAPPAATAKPAVPLVTYPARPTVPPPSVKLFHQDNDTLTLVTKDDATDEEIEALLWQFRDAAQSHGFDALHLPQKFIDARAPKVWFHVYRGSKCAGEKYIKGDKYPCGASYHGAGDFTLGSYKNASYNEGILLHGDGTETRLWDPDKN